MAVADVRLCTARDVQRRPGDAGGDSPSQVSARGHETARLGGGTRLAFSGMARRTSLANGFTLLELMVVVAIVGVLAAIAIPAFTSRQGRAYDARVMQDARNAATAQEAYFGDHLEYYEGDCALLPGANLSPGVSCEATASSSSFQIQTSHTRASKICTFSSDADPNLDCPSAVED
jgi:type IV pilus assembly protein PilA